MKKIIAKILYLLHFFELVEEENSPKSKFVLVVALRQLHRDADNEFKHSITNLNNFY